MQKTRKKRKMMGDFIQPKQRQKHSLDFQFSSEVIPRRNNNKKKRKKRKKITQRIHHEKNARNQIEKRGMRKREIRNRTFFFLFVACVCVCIIYFI
jgi:hypothetical protein